MTTSNTITLGDVPIRTGRLPANVALSMQDILHDTSSATAIDGMRSILRIVVTREDAGTLADLLSSASVDQVVAAFYQVAKFETEQYQLVNAALQAMQQPSPPPPPEPPANGSHRPRWMRRRKG